MISTWMIAAVLVASISAGSFFAGMRVESNARDAKELVKEREAQEAYKRGIEEERAKVAQQRLDLEDVSAQLAKERRARDEEEIEFRDELRKVRQSGKSLATCPPPAPPKTIIVERPVLVEGKPAPPQPAPELPVEERSPEPRFTAEFARLYDLALGPPRMPVPTDPPRTDGTPAPAGTVDAETVLEVHQVNSGIGRTCRAALEKWQEIARRNGWVGKRPKQNDQ